MNLQQLYYFRKLAEVQHYTEAAKALYITQPSLSDSISSLESELSVALFQKKGRGIGAHQIRAGILSVCESGTGDPGAWYCHYERKIRFGDRNH